MLWSGYWTLYVGPFFSKIYLSSAFQYWRYPFPGLLIFPPLCWKGLEAGGEGDDRGWDVWVASLTRWPWVWVNSGRWWWTGRPGVLRFMGSQRVGHDWVTELNWGFSPLEQSWTRLREKQLMESSSWVGSIWGWCKKKAMFWIRSLEGTKKQSL